MTVLTAAVDHDQSPPDHVEVNSHTNSSGSGSGDGNNGFVVRQDSATGSVSSSHLPMWVDADVGKWGEELIVDEWQGDNEEDNQQYRLKHGWKGQDLIHDRNSAVRIIQYYVQYGSGQLTGNSSSSSTEETNERAATTTTDTATSSTDNTQALSRGGVGTTLTGVVHFTKRAESHMGHCHGGAMTSVLDDVIGWVAFLVTGRCIPWSGYTVQVNTSLKRPIPVDSVLLVTGKITNIERRKVSVEATIIDPENDNAVHAAGTGLVVLNRGVFPGH